MTKRKINLAVLFELGKKRPIHSMFGLLFTFPVFLLLIPFLSLISGVNEAATNADYDLISDSGQSTKGILEDIETVYTVNVNNEHPSIVTYSFYQDGAKSLNKYQTFAPDIIEELSIGQEVDIKFLASESILVGLPPYSFPIYLIGLVFLIFPAIGLPFLVILLYQVKKELSLYRHGLLSNGIIVSISQNTGFMFTDFGNSKSITYEYKDEDGKSQFGKSRTSDISVTAHKSNGDEIKILISPTKPLESCLWPNQIADKLEW